MAHAALCLPLMPPRRLFKGKTLESRHYSTTHWEWNRKSRLKISLEFPANYYNWLKTLTFTVSISTRWFGSISFKKALSLNYFKFGHEMLLLSIYFIGGFHIFIGALNDFQNLIDQIFHHLHTYLFYKFIYFWT